MAEEKDHTSPMHTSVAGGFNQHTPAYWRLMLPALAGRYIFRWIEQVADVGKKPVFGLKAGRFYDVAAGLWALGTTAFFAQSTSRDIKNVFAEAVAYELDKSPQDITRSDLLKSNNKSLIKVRSNFIRYNTVRALVNSSFFASFAPGPWKGKESVDLGVGLNGAYLVGEVVMRDATFFEQLQDFIDRKVNQRHALGEDIRAIELMRLFERNARDNDPANAYRGDVNSPLWYQSLAIFERMADLMNRTYQHEPNNKANFPLPKFLYLLGHNLIQPKKVEQSLAYIEIANRYGMNALKRVVGAVRDGVQLPDALQPYPEAMPAVREAQAIPLMEMKKHVEKVSEPSSTFTGKISKSDGPEISSAII